MDVSECIVSALEQVGVDHVFGGSGQVNGSMLLALKKSNKIKTVIIRNEQGASFMACGYAMFSDKLGVCFATGGPGAFNLFSGLAVALSDSLPVLAITGYTSKYQRGKGALNESTGLNRTPDSHAMFSATTKKSYILEDPAETWDIIEEAINIAYDGRPGPVHIHIPKDVTTMEVPENRDIKITIKSRIPDEKSITAASKALSESMRKNRQIMALIGYGAIRGHAEQEVLNFIERFKIPFATTMDAKGIIPEDHALSLGAYGTSGDPGANQYFDRSEVVLAVGNSFAQNATFAFKEDLYREKTLIHINIDPDEINKVYNAQFPILSDAKPALEALHSQLLKKNVPDRNVTIEKKKWHDLPIDNEGSKIHPATLSRAISDLLPERSIILGDAGSHMLWLNCHLSLTKNQRYQNPGSFGPMASHVNGAIGVKCANTDRHVICGCGDGAYLMAGFELLTAVENRIPVTWIIFNNGEFNIIKKLLLNSFGEAAFMQFKNPDYVKYAQACGALGFRVDKIEDFAEAFKTTLSSNMPALIDVAVDSEVYPPFSMKAV